MTAFTDEQAEERKVLKKARDLQRVREFAKAAAAKNLLRTAEGREYLKWLLEDLTGALGRNPFSATPQDTAFRCGVLYVGQQIMAHLVQVDSDSFINLLKEPENAAGRTDSAEPDLFGDGDSDNGDDGAGAGEGPGFYN